MRAAGPEPVPSPGSGPASPALPGRVVIEGVAPEVDGGRFPAKRTLGETVEVTADIFAEGHDRLAAVLRHRRSGAKEWSEVPMEALPNDRWRGHFIVPELGRYEYALLAWVDGFASWQAGLQKKVAAGLEVRSELLEGAVLIAAAAARASGEAARWLTHQSELLRSEAPMNDRAAAALAPELTRAMAAVPDRTRAASYAPGLRVEVEPELARFGAWYEMFPRSSASTPARHGTFADCEARLPYVAAMGFDVLYLPPIHPIGLTYRKGRNNTPVAGPEDVGSPWGIGSPEGGHRAVHPSLGTLAEFDHLVTAARRQGLAIALDIAFQCSPDHPWVQSHPEWFRHRPDGSIQYAENPPKKYQDIYPLNFDTPAWRELWEELKQVILFWVDHGVTVFRVDNPHTKPFAFWEWLIREVRSVRPDVIFLSEAFTRPKILRYLAKCGFSQSYTYFTWRNTKQELIDFVTELADPEFRQYLRPNFFANTPDILHEFLQTGGRAAHQIRLILAATLAGTYGIYGPPFELAEAAAVPGTEEYQDSEKYQLRHWALDAPGSLRELIARVNRIRRENRAFRDDVPPWFLEIDNDRLLAYVRASADRDNLILVVVNLDPHYPHQGWLRVPCEQLGLDPAHPYQVHDLLSDARYLWHGERNYVALDPASMPAHIFRIRRRLKREQDFDYYT
jgi:starch synthase (maltosyl-transferring)